MLAGCKMERMLPACGARGTVRSCGQQFESITAAASCVRGQGEA
jgi:hypothetical protein